MRIKKHDSNFTGFINNHHLIGFTATMRPMHRSDYLPETNVTVCLNEPARGRKCCCDNGDGRSSTESLLAFLLHTSTYQSSIDVVDGQARRSLRSARSLLTLIVTVSHASNQSVFSFLCQLSTWHCPHSPAAAVEQSIGIS